MKFLRALTGGLIGSIILTAMHQALKNNYSNAPRMDLLGEEAIEKGLDKLGIDAPQEETLYNIALAGDILFNALFFSLAATTISSCSKGHLAGHCSRCGRCNAPGEARA